MKRYILLSLLILTCTSIIAREEAKEDYFEYFDEESLLRKACKNHRQAWLFKDDVEKGCDTLREFFGVFMNGSHGKPGHGSTIEALSQSQHEINQAIIQILLNRKTTITSHHLELIDREWEYLIAATASLRQERDQRKRVARILQSVEPR